MKDKQAEILMCNIGYNKYLSQNRKKEEEQKFVQRNQPRDPVHLSIH